ncbi:MAG: SDR family NAD(P)-dependent oxidoreductase [Nanoarchaeota archaeon]
MFNLKNKVAVITGSRRGIGRGIAEVFAKAGANVVISDVDKKESEQTARQIAAKYKVKALAIRCDVSKKSDVDSLLRQTVKKFKKVDILVNNAGIFFQKSLLDYKEEDWDKMVDINLKSIYLCSQAAARYMIPMKKGKIINIASIAGIIGYPGAAAYCASKGGIITLTKELALELATYKINVNAIAPGAIDTPMTAFLKNNKKILQQTLVNIPLKRMGKPEEIGYAALFLASQEADYVTGQTVVVDGGWTIQ